jgi:hypothetical protein
MALGLEQFPDIAKTSDDVIKAIRKQAECVPEPPRKGMHTQLSHGVNAEIRNWSRKSNGD